VHTRAAAAVIGTHNPATPTNQFAYRFLIPSSELAADPETAHFLDGDDGRIKFYIGEEKRIVWYPCRKYVASATLQDSLREELT
jgi:salicylate hydroxylase